MRPSDKKLILTLLRFMPHVVFAVVVLTLGAVLLDFVLSVLFPHRAWVWSSIMLPYSSWSGWRLYNYIAKLSKAAYKAD